jgi:hypothetical protein
MRPTILNIRLGGGLQPPTANQPLLDQRAGGSEILLAWLETQLGLLKKSQSLSSRVATYRHSLKSVKGAAYSASLEADSWATGAELLSRREECDARALVKIKKRQ